MQSADTSVCISLPAAAAAEENFVYFYSVRKSDRPSSCQSCSRYRIKTSIFTDEIKVADVEFVCTPKICSSCQLSCTTDLRNINKNSTSEMLDEMPTVQYS